MGELRLTDITAPIDGEPEPAVNGDVVDGGVVDDSGTDVAADSGAAGEAMKKVSFKKVSAESKDGLMGELRSTDILAGNYRKRAGNYLYNKLLREHAPDIGKIEMRVVVAKVVEGIAGQIPPGTSIADFIGCYIVCLYCTHIITYLHLGTGRFICKGGDALLSAVQRNYKIACALREVAKRFNKEEGESGGIDVVALSPVAGEVVKKTPCKKDSPSLCSAYTGQSKRRKLSSDTAVNGDALDGGVIDDGVVDDGCGQIVVTNNDVLCDRDREYSSHQGNINFREVVHFYSDAYHNARTLQEKSQIVKNIIDEVLRKGARFLWKKNLGWYDGDIKKARQKVCLCQLEPVTNSSNTMVSHFNYCEITCGRSHVL